VPRHKEPPFNILNGKVIGSCLPRHRGKEFIKFLNQLEKEVPPELDIHEDARFSVETGDPG